MGADVRVRSAKSGAGITNPIVCVPAVGIGEEDIRLAASVRFAAARVVSTSQIADAQSAGIAANAYAAARPAAHDCDPGSPPLRSTSKSIFFLFE